VWHILYGVKKKLAIDGMQREHIPRNVWVQSEKITILLPMFFS